jgi:ABC-type multidrug transport system ATPase subunit
MLSRRIRDATRVCQPAEDDVCEDYWADSSGRKHFAKYHGSRAGAVSAAGLSSRGRQAISSCVPKPAIAVDSLEKSFPPARSGLRMYLQPFERPTAVALAGVSLEVREGEALALLGANGAGKSTLLRILATLLLPTRGAARIAGYDAVREPREVRRRLGYHAGTDHGFYGRLTGRENLRFFGSLNHLSNAAAKQRVSTLAGQFRLEEALDRQVRTLSSGTVQRLSLARALMHQPSVLLLDEPTRSLDAIAAMEFRRFLKKEIVQRAGTSLLFASHTLPEVELLGDRVAVIDRGRLLACDTPAALKHRTGTTSLEGAFLHLTGRSHQGPAEDDAG